MFSALRSHLVAAGLVIVWAGCWVAPASGQPGTGTGSCDAPMPEARSAEAVAALQSDTTAAAAVRAERVRSLRNCVAPDDDAYDRTYTAEVDLWIEAGRIQRAMDTAETAMTDPRFDRRDTKVAMLRTVGRAAALAGHTGPGAHFLQTAQLETRQAPFDLRAALGTEVAHVQMMASQYEEARKTLFETSKLPTDSLSAGVRAAFLQARSWSHLGAALEGAGGNLKAGRRYQSTADSLLRRIPTGASGAPVLRATVLRARLVTQGAGYAVLAGRLGHAFDLAETAHPLAEASGDVWTRQQLRYVQSHLARERGSLDAARAHLDAITRLADAHGVETFVPIVLVERVRLAAQAGNRDAAFAAVRAVGETDNLRPYYFKQATSAYADVFGDFGGSAVPTWLQIVGLVFALTLVTQVVWHFAATSEASATDEAPSGGARGSGPGASRLENPVSDEASSDDTDTGPEPEALLPPDQPETPPPYHTPRGLDDPTPSPHAINSFDTQASMDSEEIRRIIDATSFELTKQDDAAPPEAPPSDPLTSIQRSRRKPPIKLPCYNLDGSKTDSIRLPSAFAEDLAIRRVVGLKLSDHVLLVYRLQNASELVVRHDPSTGRFTPIREGRTFSGFPIGRVG